MDQLFQLEENFHIHAYLSYRHGELGDKARELLETLCSEQNISLRYDKNQLENGDSLREFMADLSAARCVFLFLSPNYFRSAYTLFELVSINELADLDQRFIFPLRLTESMVTYQWTAAKHCFDSNNVICNEHACLSELGNDHHPDGNIPVCNIAVRNELARLLSVEDASHDSLWQRINSAWENIIFKHLDRVNVSLYSANANVELDKLLGKAKTEVNAAINDSTKTLHNTLITKITAILNGKNINADNQLRDELDLTANNDLANIATQLVKKTEVGEALAILTRVLEDKRALLDTKSSEWKTCFVDAEKLCGWLLLNSVDPVWWFHNEIKLKKTAKTSITGNYVLADSNYVEVIISRDLLQNARFVLDKNKQPKPASQKYDVLLFDAQSPHAMKDELLTRIYKDLLGEAPSSDIDLLSKIVNRVKTHYKTQKGKPIYYLVSQDYINILESTDYADVKAQLAGYLQFICCDKPAKPDERQACTEDQTQLLDQVAYLISLQD